MVLEYLVGAIQETINIKTKGYLIMSVRVHMKLSEAVIIYPGQHWGQKVNFKRLIMVSCKKLLWLQVHGAYGSGIKDKLDQNLNLYHLQEGRNFTDLRKLEICLRYNRIKISRNFVWQ